MSSKALRYAEEVLGVHTILDEVADLVNDLDKTFDGLDKAQDLRRELDEQYADREVELINEKRGVHPNMSDTRFKSEFKIWEREDFALRTIRTELNKVRSEIQGLEYDAESLKLQIKAGTARMVELGGYLNYLAAVKQEAGNRAETVNQREET